MIIKMVAKPVSTDVALQILGSLVGEVHRQNVPGVVMCQDVGTRHRVYVYALPARYAEPFTELLRGLADKYKDDVLALADDSTLTSA